MGRNHTTGTAGTDQPDSIERTGVPARTRNRHRRRLVAVVGFVALAATGCGSDNDEESAEPATEETDDSGDAGAIAGDGEARAGDASEDTSDATAPETGGAASAGLPIDDFGRDNIRNVGLTMSTSNVADTSDDIRRIVTGNGGAVFSSDVTIGDEEENGSVPGGGRIVVRIPPADLDQLVTELDGAGFVSRLSQDSQDVTDQLVDLDIRIRQAETGIERIEILLSQASELDDVFAIETELTNRQVELEQLRAAERNTDDLVSLATLTIEIEHRTPDDLEAIEESGDGIVDAFANGWNAFVGAVFAVGFVLAVMAPFLLTALVVVALAWLIGRRWTRRQTVRREDERNRADRAGDQTVIPPSHTTPPPPIAHPHRPDEQSSPPTAGTATMTESPVGSAQTADDAPRDD